MKMQQLNLDKFKKIITQLKAKGQWLNVIVAIVLGILSLVMANMYLSSKSDEISKKIEAENNVPMVQAIVANVNLNVGDVLTDDVFAARDVPKEFYESTSFPPQLSSELVGQKLAYPVARGVPIQKNDIDPAGKAFSNVIKEGYRAITFQVDDTNSISTMIIPGNHVDLLLVIQKENGDEVRPLLEDVTVIATGEETNAAKNVSMYDQENKRSYSTVTVQLDPESANKLILAQVVGKINVVLRGNAEKDLVKSPVITSSSLLGNAGGGGPGRHAPREDKVEMIVGGAEGSGASYSNVLGGGPNKLDLTKDLAAKITQGLNAANAAKDSKQVDSKLQGQQAPQKKSNFLN